MSTRSWLWVLPAILAAGLALAGKQAPAGGQTTRYEPVLEVRQVFPEDVEAGALIPGAVYVRNTGRVAAQGLTVTDVLPAGFDLVEASPAPRRNGNTLLWLADTLEPGDELVFCLRLAPRATAGPAAPRNTVTVTFQTGVSDTTAVEVEGPDLGVIVSGPETAVAGDTVALAVTVTNEGTRPAQDVVLQTLLPDGLCHAHGRDLEKAIGTLEPDESRTVHLQVTPRRGGEFRVRVQVRAREAAPVACEAPLCVQETRLGITAHGPRQCYRDWPCTYRFTVRNDGPGDTRQASLQIELPPGIALLRAGNGGEYEARTQRVGWRLPNLGVGETCTVAWEGVAQESGAQEGKVILKAGEAGSRQLLWTTRVIDTAPARNVGQVSNLPK